VLAQVVYYFTAAVALGAPGREVAFTVPTGNFGDIYAGHVARAMGLPVARLVIATNQNDILHRTLETGRQVKGGVVPSISPSMDIQVSSNFERALFEACGRDAGEVRARMASLSQAGGFDLGEAAWEWLRARFSSGRATEAETAATIARVAATTGEILCPHTAVGVHVAEHFLGPVPMVTLATAHPGKFPDAVAAATGVRPPLPSRMGDLYERPERVTRVGNDLGALRSIIRARI
jgi:threonine synthase